jgi:hypothetical protein
MPWMSGIRVDAPGYDSIELVVWTAEEEMFFPDGRPAPQDHDRA